MDKWNDKILDFFTNITKISKKDLFLYSKNSFKYNFNNLIYNKVKYIFYNYAYGDNIIYTIIGINEDQTDYDINLAVNIFTNFRTNLELINKKKPLFYLQILDNFDCIYLFTTIFNKNIYYKNINNVLYSNLGFKSLDKCIKFNNICSIYYKNNNIYKRINNKIYKYIKNKYILILYNEKKIYYKTYNIYIKKIIESLFCSNIIYNNILFLFI